MDVYLLVQARVCKIQACDVPQLKRVPAPLLTRPPWQQPAAALPPCALVRRAGLPCSLLLPARGYCGAAAGLKAACC
jgi:hypothetical protein